LLLKSAELLSQRLVFEFDLNVVQTDIII